MQAAHSSLQQEQLLPTMKLLTALVAVLLAAALLAVGPAAAAPAASSTPLVLEAEHQNVTATLDQGGASVGCCFSIQRGRHLWRVV